MSDPATFNVHQPALGVEDTRAHKQSPTYGTAFSGHGSTPDMALSKEEERLVLKLDLTFVPMITLIYFVAYLDRNSIGNARLMGLEKDLELTSSQFYNCLTGFYVGYIIFMLQGNICLRLPHVRAPLVFGIGILLFGSFCTASAAAQDYATVLTLRVFVGGSQAFVQGLGLYTSCWYKRDELATRSGLLFSAATLAGAFSGLIAYAVQKDLTKTATGLAPWRWLFIIEGCAAIFVGLVTILVLPSFADKMRGRKSWLLNATEIDLAVERAKGYNSAGAEFTTQQIWIALRDPKSWLFACINAGVVLGLASVGSFLPTFIKAFGYNAKRAQLFSVIPYASAFLSTITISFWSDRSNIKGPLLVSTLSAACIGYIILLSVHSVGVLVFATCLITAGLYPSVILLNTWLAVNTGGFTKRGTVWAMVEIFGQSFAIMGTHIYTSPPRFVKGHAIVLGFLLFGIACTMALMGCMKHMNAKKEAEVQRYLSQDEQHPHMEKSLEEEGDDHLGFRYII